MFVSLVLHPLQTSFFRETSKHMAQILEVLYTIGGSMAPWPLDFGQEALFFQRWVGAGVFPTCLVSVLQGIMGCHDISDFEGE